MKTSALKAIKFLNEDVSLVEDVIRAVTCNDVLRKNGKQWEAYYFGYSDRGFSFIGSKADATFYACVMVQNVDEIVSTMDGVTIVL